MKMALIMLGVLFLAFYAIPTGWELVGLGELMREGGALGGLLLLLLVLAIFGIPAWILTKLGLIGGDWPDDSGTI